MKQEILYSQDKVRYEYLWSVFLHNGDDVTVNANQLSVKDGCLVFSIDNDVVGAVFSPNEWRSVHNLSAIETDLFMCTHQYMGKDNQENFIYHRQAQA